jgi:hypothetical protein
MAPPSWTSTFEAAPGRILTARLKITERITLAGLVAQPVTAPDDQLINEAALAARDADPAIVVVGLTAEQETEARDKMTLTLPGRQDELVRAVAAAARRTVVVINSATPVLMGWLDDVDAVLSIGLPGRRAVMRWQTCCWVPRSRPVAWSPLFPQPTGMVPPGPSLRRTARWIIRKGPGRLPRLVRIRGRTSFLVRRGTGLGRLGVSLGQLQPNREHRVTDSGAGQHREPDFP